MELLYSFLRQIFEDYRPGERLTTNDVHSQAADEVYPVSLNYIYFVTSSFKISRTTPIWLAVV